MSTPDRLTTTAKSADPGLIRRLTPVIGLALLSPIVAEYLLGNSSIAALPDVWIIAPMYGGAAILIREAARRAGGGWPTIVTLGLAYGVLQPAVIDFAMFNPSFLGRDFLTATHVPVLGISAYYAIAFSVGHAVWSIAVPIAIVETFVPERRTKPWLRAPGIAITAVLFVLSSGVLAWYLHSQDGFFPSAGQVAGTAVVVGGLIGIAFVVGRWSPPESTASVPRPLVVGIVSFVAASLFVASPVSWLGVALLLTLIAVMTAVVTRWSRRNGWGEVHRLALIGGALLTYAWLAFIVTPFDEVSETVNLIGNVVFALGAVVLLVVAYAKIRRIDDPLDSASRGA